MRTLLLSKSDETYMQKCATELETAKLAYGIIIGHQAEVDKCIVVHLAKSNEEDELEQTLVEGGSLSVPTHSLQSFDDIDTHALSNQWLSACKMIPGSFSVLGVFVSAVEESVLDERTFKIAKQLLYDINSLIQGKSFSVVTEDSVNCDYIFMVHSSNAKKTVCKSYTHSLNGGSFAPMECRFVEKPFEWYTIDSNYEIDEIFPIKEQMKKVNIEQQFEKVIDWVRKSLLDSEIFLQSEQVDDTLTLDAYVKKKNRNSQQHQPVFNECLRATIYQPTKCQAYAGQSASKVCNFSGTMRFAGIVSSRVYCNPRNNLAEVKRFVRDDVLRSLTARIQTYCDGLTEPNINNDSRFISDPPRRVYFTLPSGNMSTPIQCSEYIFRGEAPTVVVAQAKQVLDLEIDSESIIGYIEGPPDDDTFVETSTYSETSTAASVSPMSDHMRMFYIAGIVVSLIVLILALLFQFYWKS